MSFGAYNALLQMLGIRTAQQALTVMICLDHQQVGLLHSRKHGFGDFPGIGDDASATATSMQ